MRFALIATGAAAVVAVPLALSAAGPQMSGDQFLSAVRCTAYEEAVQPRVQLNQVKMQLNAEARRQSPETFTQARAEVGAIARQAVNSESATDAATIRQDRAEACAGAQLAIGATNASAA